MSVNLNAGERERRLLRGDAPPGLILILNMATLTDEETLEWMQNNSIHVELHHDHQAKETSVKLSAPNGASSRVTVSFAKGTAGIRSAENIAISELKKRLSE